MTVARAVPPNPEGLQGEVRRRAGWTLTTVDAPSQCESKCEPEGKTPGLTKGGPITKKEDNLFSPNPSPREPGSAKPSTHVGRTQPATPAGGQDAVCCATQRKVRLTRRPCSPGTVRCAYSDCAGPSMTKRSPWSRVIEEGTSHDAQRTWNSTEWPKLILTVSSG